MPEYSADTEAILDRLKKEGSYIRNANKGNSLKNVNINLTKMQGVLNAINTNVLAQTSAFAASAANQAKVQQEAAEKSRRKEELAEVIDPRQKEIDDLKMKASLLRAKSDLKNAKGPGLIATVKDKASMGFIAKMAAIGGTSFIAGSILKGALDSIYDPDGTGGGIIGVATKKLEALPDEISVKVEAGVSRAMNDFKNDPAVSSILNTLSSLTSPTGIIALIGTLIGGGMITRFGMKGIAEWFNDGRLRDFDKLDRAERAGKIPKSTNYGPEFDKPAYQRQGATPKPSTVSMNPIDSSVTRANAAANAPKPVTLGKLAGEASLKVGKAIGTASQKVPYIGPVVLAADLAQNALQGANIQKLSDEAIINFIKSGEFKKNQTTLADVALETGISAGAGAAIGSIVPGAGTMAGSIAGGAGGLISGFGRMGIEKYKDWGDIGKDSIPNAVEAAIKRQNELYNSEGLSPEGMKRKLANAAENIEGARGILAEQLEEIDNDISVIQTELDAVRAKKVTGGRNQRTKSNKIKSLTNKINDLNNSKAPISTQLENTLMIQKLSNEEMQRFLESYGKKPKISSLDKSGLSEMLAMAGGGGFYSSINNTNNYYTTTTSSGGNSYFNHNEVIAGVGESRENTAMG